MEDKKLSKANRILILILAITFAVFIAEIAYLKVVKAEQKPNVKINETMGDVLENSLFSDYIEKEYSRKNAGLSLKRDDLENLRYSDYSTVHISMWEEEMLEESVYELYFGKKIKYSSYCIESLHDLKDYFEAITQNEIVPSSVLVTIDPYVLYNRYYGKVEYEIEAPTYEEFLEDNIFSFVDSFPNIEFTFIISPVSFSYLEELGDKAEDMFANWYAFSMYLRWWDNARVIFYGSEEWLVTNSYNFVTDHTVDGDLSRLIYTYIYNDDTYRVTPPELSEKCNQIKQLHSEYLGLKEDNKKLSATKIVFYGDNIIALSEQRTAVTSGVVKGLTGARVYDLSLEGTKAYSDEPGSFIDVAAKGVGRDGAAFEKECNADDDIIFVIMYGINDYYEKVKIEDFAKGLFAGTENLIQDYPNAKFLFVSPYRVLDYGLRIDEQQYVDAVRDVARGYHAEYLDLYSGLEITEDNITEYLADGTNATLPTHYLIGKLIAEKLRKMK